MKEKPHYEEIVFTRNEHETQDQLFEKVGKQLQLLLNEGYNAVVRYDDYEIVVIEYEHDENFDAWGVSRPTWLTYVEHEELMDKRVSEEEESDEEYPSSSNDRLHDSFFDYYNDDDDTPDCENDTNDSYSIYTGYHCTVENPDECPQYADCFDCPKCVSTNKKS